MVETVDQFETFLGRNASTIKDERKALAKKGFGLYSIRVNKYNGSPVDPFRDDMVSEFVGLPLWHSVNKFTYNRYVEYLKTRNISCYEYVMINMDK